MNAANHTPDLNSAAGCRDLALAFRQPGDPFPLLAQIGELDWMAEAWLIEHPEPAAAQTGAVGRVTALLRLFRPGVVDRPISPRPRQKRKSRPFRKPRLSGFIRGCLVAPLAAALCLGQTGEPVLDSKAQTLSQKSIDASANTITNIANASIASAAAIDASKLSNAARDVSKAINIFLPTTADTNKIQFDYPQAVTIQEVHCSTDVGTATIQLDERVKTTPNTAGTNVLTASLVCDTGDESTTSFSNAAIAADAPVNLQITATASTPTIVRIHVQARLD